MNEQNNPQLNEPIQSPKNTWIIIITIVITAMVVGGGVYAWQRSNQKSIEQAMQQKISVLQDQINQLQQAQIIIKTSTASLFCVGYCQSSTTISSKKIIFSRNGHDNKGKPLPEISKEASISNEEWKRILNSINIEEFTSLPDIIGCPGCADGPIETIEIISGSIDKKVSFDPLTPPSEVDNLIKELGNIISSKFKD